MRRRTIYGFLIPALVAASLAAEGQPKQKMTRDGRDWVVEISGVVPAASRLQLRPGQGNIELRGGPESEISYHIRKRVRAASEAQARRILAAYNLRTRRAGDLLELVMDAQGPNFRTSRMAADFVLTVPRSLLRADLLTRGGNLRVEGIDGEASALTAGGDIFVDRIGGAVKLETAGGDVQLGEVGGRVQVETAGGGINLKDCGGEAILVTHGGAITAGSCKKNVRARTAGGSIRIAKAGGDVEAETAGGSVNVDQCGGRVIAASAGGGIIVGSSRGLVRAGTQSGEIRLWKIAGPVEAETALGSITALVIADRRSWAQSQLATSGGDITVYLPENLAVSVQAIIEMATGKHGIRSDFPLVFKKQDLALGPKEVFGEIQLNGGGAPLKIRTTSGNIEIRKVKNAPNQ